MQKLQKIVEMVSKAITFLRIAADTFTYFSEQLEKHNLTKKSIENGVQEQK